MRNTAFSDILSFVSKVRTKFLVCAFAMASFPGVAHACIWRISDSGMPFPPCPMNDAQVQTRLRQGTVRELVQAGELAGEVYNMKLENQGRQGTNDVIEQFVSKLDDLTGASDVNPLPSLVAAYETAPIMIPLEGDNGVQFVMLPTGTSGNDTTATRGFDDIKRYFGNIDSLRKLYNYSGAGDSASWRRVVEIDSMIRSSSTGDSSLREVGNRYAGRYDSISAGSGIAEAKISQAMVDKELLNAASRRASARAVYGTGNVDRGGRDAATSAMIEKRNGGHPK